MPRMEGIVEEVVFRNDNNGFTVLSIKTGRERVSAVGVIGPVAAGETLLIEGEWGEHPDYGRQIRITSCESVQPSTVGAIEKYLGSGVIRGVGPATAKLIVQQFGKDTLDVLDMNPDRLIEVGGIGPKRAAMIAQSYMEQRAARQTLVFLQGLGLSAALSARIYKIFGDAAQHIIRRNPYLLVEKVEGVGFKTADAIAFAQGVEPEDLQRLMCGILYALSEAMNGGGHMYLPLENLMPYAARLLGVDEELIDNALRTLVLERKVILWAREEQQVAYLPALFEAEGDVARRLAEMLSCEEACDEAALDVQISEYERRMSVELCREQREAVRAAASGTLTIITGGPGTGKTTSIRCIIQLLAQRGEVQLCAPTGRAAKRMSEATGCEARTIHRLLEYGGDEESFMRNQDHPLDADAVIVDEVSMVDILLLRALLRALKPGTRLVLVGDADQLPSVGAGNVLRDLIDSGAIPVVRLTEIFRQAEESMIVVNAHRINHGELPVLNQKHSDFFLERVGTPDQALKSVLSLVSRRLPDYMGLDSLRQIQVMAPMKKGDVGVWRINRVLQEQLNPPAHGRHELQRGDMILREGDKVMQIRNNYQLEWTRGGEDGMGVFNGDIGFVQSVDARERLVWVLFDDDRLCQYGDAELEELELAYCMSVHKSQGSEFEAVVLPLLSGPPMLFTRNLLYTAVTRARRLVVLVGREGCVAQMVRNNHIAQRYSALGERLQLVMGD